MTAEVKKPKILRMPPELAAEIKRRADTVGISENEWMVRALRYAILAKGGKLRHVQVWEL